MNYLVQIEFRYTDFKNGEREHNSKTVTIGVYEAAQEAYNAGNAVLELLETQFKLNQNYNRKERLSANGGWVGGPKHLITNLGYLKTPFEFYLQVTKLKYDDIQTVTTQVLEAVERFRNRQEEG